MDTINVSNEGTPKSNLILPVRKLRLTKENPYRIYKIAIWVYFLLLIFEGALRKWILPGLSGPLLIIRDPIAIWLVVSTWRRGILIFNGYLTGMFLAGSLAFFAALLVGHGNILVGLYGVRVLVVHFPIIFIMGSVFDRDDVLKIGRFLIWLSLPMTLLLVLQFYS